MSTCGNAISNATVEVCLNTSFCVNSSGTFITTSDGRRMTKITFNKLNENRNYFHSTIYLFLKERMMVSQQVTICKLFLKLFMWKCLYSSAATFDVQKTLLNGVISDGIVCLNIEFALGSTSKSCFSKLKSSDTGNTVQFLTTNETSRCISNVPPISIDILSTDPDAVDEIDTNPACKLTGVVVSNYTQNSSFKPTAG